MPNMFGYSRYEVAVTRWKVIALLLISSLIISIGEAAIIVDHTAVDGIEQIPDYWIEQVKEITVIHTNQSNDMQVLCRFSNINAMNGVFNVEISTDGCLCLDGQNTWWNIIGITGA